MPSGNVQRTEVGQVQILGAEATFSETPRWPPALVKIFLGVEGALVPEQAQNCPRM